VGAAQVSLSARVDAVESAAARRGPCRCDEHLETMRGWFAALEKGFVERFGSGTGLRGKKGVFFFLVFMAFGFDFYYGVGLLLVPTLPDVKVFFKKIK
jgi:hypothetical protein